MSKHWIGSFASTTYNYFGIRMVNGTVDVTLPIDITTTDTNATLTYTGIYRRSAVSDMGFKYSYPTLIGTFKDSTQVIKFTPTAISETTISGKYVSENPCDTGTFSLKVVT